MLEPCAEYNFNSFAGSLLHYGVICRIAKKCLFTLGVQQLINSQEKIFLELFQYHSAHLCSLK